jgi:hypothetical protein
VHVDQERPRAEDVQALALAPPAPADDLERGLARLAAAHQADDRRPGDEARPRDRRGLHGDGRRALGRHGRGLVQDRQAVDDLGGFGFGHRRIVVAD